MTLTTTETLTVNGIALNTYAYNITTGTGRETTPAIRGTNVQVLGRSGQLYLPLKARDVGTITLSMFILGAAASGTPASPYSNQRIQYVTNREMLFQLFTSNAALLHLVQTMPDNTTRECYAECLEAVSPTTVAGRTASTFSAALSIPASYWQDTSPLTFTQTNAVSGTVYNMTQFEPSTGNIEDAAITVTGPITNPVVTDPISGCSISLNGTVPSTQTWVIDASQFTSIVNGVSQLSLTTHLGSPRLYVIAPPAAGGPPVISLTGTGTTAATSISVTARNKYVVA